MKKNLSLIKMAWLTGVWIIPICLANANESIPVHTHQSQTDRYDMNASSITADQANNNDADIQLMKKIRRSIQKSNLSPTARNVKIIAIDGHVTLRGDVRTSQEKSTIENEAVKNAGRENVTSEITVLGK